MENFFHSIPYFNNSIFHIEIFLPFHSIACSGDKKIFRQSQNFLAGIRKIWAKLEILGQQQQLIADNNY